MAILYFKIIGYCDFCLLRQFLWSQQCHNKRTSLHHKMRYFNILSSGEIETARGYIRLERRLIEELSRGGQVALPRPEEGEEEEWQRMTETSHC